MIIHTYQICDIHTYIIYVIYIAYNNICTSPPLSGWKESESLPRVVHTDCHVSLPGVVSGHARDGEAERGWTGMCERGEGGEETLVSRGFKVAQLWRSGS